jgi:hypothetical protein
MILDKDCDRILDKALKEGLIVRIYKFEYGSP